MRVRSAAQARLGAATDRFAKFVSSRVPAQSRFRPLMRSLRRRLPAAKPIEPLTLLIAEFARTYSKPFFVQVGANDGDKGDYLETYVNTRAWTGVLVEPIPYVFEDLTKRHGSNVRLTLVNAAIADHDGTAKLYYLPRDDTADLPTWYDALATFRKEVLLKHTPWIPDIDSRITTIEVPTLTFESLCKAHRIDRLDLVQIDTEGYDYEIVRQIDLDKYMPTLVMYEHYHLEPDERTACELFLRSHGYSTISNFMDTVAVRIDASDKRSRRLGNLLTKLQDKQN